MVCPLLKVINPLSRLLTGDFTYQHGIGNNSHSVSGLCLARLGTAECVCFFSDYLGLELSDTVLEHIGWVGEDAGDVASMQQVSSGRLLFTVIGIGEGNVFTASSSLEEVFFFSVIIQRPEYSGRFLSSLGSLLCIDP